MLKTIFINVLKLSIAAGLIAWLVTSGKLDFKLLAELMDHPLAICLAVALTIFNFWLVSIRWKKILSARTTKNIPVIGLMKITWIGQFFSSVLPGSVSGDLIKILYVQNYEKDMSKKFLFASILIDRVMGLSGLILLVGLSSLMFSSHILKNAPAMGPLLVYNYVLVGLILLAFSVFIFCNHFIRSLLLKLRSLFLAGLWDKIIPLWDDLVSIRSRLIKSLALSILIQFVGVVVFWALIFPFVGDRMDFVQALAFIPVGLMTLALPVAPGGLGVGHMIFQKLFEFSGISNGASLFNIYFVVNLCLNVLGVIPYILNKRKEN